MVPGEVMQFKKYETNMIELALSWFLPVEHISMYSKVIKIEL